MQIIDNSLWCPMDREVHSYADCQVTYRNCQEPPSKSVLAEANKRGVKTGVT